MIVNENNDINVKDTKILFEEIILKNQNFKIENINYIYSIYNKIKYYYDKNIRYINQEVLNNKIKELKYKIRENLNDINNYIELISVMIKVNEINFNYKPREIQIISILFFLFKDKNIGLIEEILTGEGKTIIMI